MLGAIGNMPHWKVVKNLTCLARTSSRACGHALPVSVAPPPSKQDQKESSAWPARTHGGFERETHTVNGVKTAVLTAGRGEPLVFFHGAGTVTASISPGRGRRSSGSSFPIHPGFGDSADDPSVQRHARLRHALPRPVRRARRSTSFNLIGFSLGGWLAAKFAMEHGRRVEKLVLVGPAGSARQDAADRRRAEPAAGEDSRVAGVELRRDKAVPAGKAGSRLHWRALSRRRRRWRGCCGSILTIGKCRAICIG